MKPKKQSTLMKSSKEFNGCSLVCLSQFFSITQMMLSRKRKEIWRVWVGKMHQEGSKGNMSLNMAIRELDGVIDWLSICGAAKSKGISCVATETMGITYVSIESMGANCAFDDKTTINEGKLFESSTRVGTCIVIEVMLSHAINSVGILVVSGTSLVKCC